MAGKQQRAAKKAGKATRSGWATPPSPLTVYRDGLRDALGRGGRTLAAMRRALNTYGAGTLESADARVKVWSDLHLGHANIIGYQDRPFPGVEQMDATLWANWSTAVEPEDTLVCVGDLAMGGALSDETWERVRTMPGDPKVLIVGNHDVGGDGKLRVQGFERNLAVLVTPGESAPDLDPRAVAGGAGRACERARSHARAAGRGAAHQRVGGAARLPADRAGPVAPAGGGPDRRRRAAGGDHAGAGATRRGRDMTVQLASDLHQTGRCARSVRWHGAGRTRP